MTSAIVSTMALNAVTGSSLNSIEELIEALDEAKENPLNGGGSTPSGGSGGGSVSEPLI